MQTVPLTAEQIQYFMELSQRNDVQVIDTIVDDSPSPIEEDVEENIDDSTEEQAEERVEEEFEEQVEEPEINELDENQFALIDSEIGSVPEGSMIDVYLGEIQRKLRTGEISYQFVKSNFWIYPSSSFFALKNKISIDLSLLCTLRGFIWLPHKWRNRSL